MSTEDFGHEKVFLQEIHTLSFITPILANSLAFPLSMSNFDIDEDSVVIDEGNEYLHRDYYLKIGTWDFYSAAQELVEKGKYKTFINLLANAKLADQNHNCLTVLFKNLDMNYREARVLEVIFESVESIISGLNIQMLFDSGRDPENEDERLLVDLKSLLEAYKKRK